MQFQRFDPQDNAVPGKSMIGINTLWRRDWDRNAMAVEIM